METTQLSAEVEKELLENFFGQTREILNDYFSERDFFPSNSQLFAFVLISPITLAIASDGNLDMTETTMLVDIATYFDRSVLPKEFDELSQPENILSNKDFKRMIYSELRYLCLSMGKYENQMIEALRKLIDLDEKLSKKKNDPRISIKNRVVQMMNSVIYNNLGTDSEEEKKVKQIFDALNLSN